MPGLPLSAEFVEDPCPQLHYCSLGLPEAATLVSVSVESCNGAMEEAARQVAVGHECFFLCETTL